MSVKLRQIGNSQGFIVPAPLLRELGFGEGDEYELIRVGGSLLVTRVDAEYADAMAAYEEVVANYRQTLNDLAR